MPVIDARDPKGPPRPDDLRQIISDLIGEDLAAAMRIYDAELRSTNPVVADILKHTNRYRGKQLRPSLLLLAAQATGGINTSHHTLAAVVEMIHVATLLHDDVLDEASVRRHVATVNSRWNNETSVLFGDYLFTHAFHLAAAVESTEACRRIGAATNRLCEGELTQVNSRGNLELVEAAYFEIIEGKTGELCAVSAELGARYAGADESIVSACADYGRLLGVAFQIADDILDLVGSKVETGKTLGTDIEKQKLTLPMIHMLSVLTGQELDLARALLNEPDATTRERLEPLVAKSRSIEYAMSRAQSIAGEASASIATLPDSPAKQLLMQMAEQAVNRRQ